MESVLSAPDNYHVVIDGHVWSKVNDTEILREAENLVPDPSDIFVVTYPKSGTTWIQHICLQLLRGLDYAKEEKAIRNSSRFIELRSVESFKNTDKPRLLKSHLDIDRLPWNDQNKYIYCVRNPKDVLVSYFFHYKHINLNNFKGSFDEFFDMFITGKILYDSYFDHLLGYLPHIRKPNVLFLKYEEMLENLEETVKRIGYFLGGEALERASKPEYVKAVVENSSFSSMKEKEFLLIGQIHSNQSGSFFRKGVKNGWREMLSKEKSDKIDEVFYEKFKGTEVKSWWQEEMKISIEA